jgi:hypothetical protein
MRIKLLLLVVCSVVAAVALGFVTGLHSGGRTVTGLHPYGGTSLGIDYGALVLAASGVLLLLRQRQRRQGRSAADALAHSGDQQGAR